MKSQLTISPKCVQSLNHKTFNTECTWLTISTTQAIYKKYARCLVIKQLTRNELFCCFWVQTDSQRFLKNKKQKHQSTFIDNEFRSQPSGILFGGIRGIVWLNSTIISSKHFLFAHSDFSLWVINGKFWEKKKKRDIRLWLRVNRE